MGNILLTGDEIESVFVEEVGRCPNDDERRVSCSLCYAQARKICKNVSSIEADVEDVRDGLRDILETLWYVV